MLIKNNQYSGESFECPTDSKTNALVKEIKGLIIQILTEHRSGLSLAQIPLQLKKRFSKSYNIQALGFPKLKNLLATMPEL